MLHTRSLLTLALLLTTAACDGGDSGGAPAPDAGADSGAAGPPFRLDLVTFNMALTTTVKGPAERLPEIVAALGALDADVLCLQEAFVGVAAPADVAAMLEQTYPHAYFSDIPNQTSLGPGILLVSKHPLVETDALRFASEDNLGVVDRSALSAELALDGRTFRVACTHLSAGLAEPAIDVRVEEVRELVSWLDDKPDVDGPTFLLGDFNAGPDPVGACTPTTNPACEAPDTTSYEEVLESFDDPNTELGCTQCKQQFDSLQVLGLFSTEPDQRIDHCFVRDLQPYVHLGSETVLDEKVAITFRDETLEHLSDHIGVRCSFGEP